MEFVRPKKFLGQHFLKDEAIALKIVQSLRPEGVYDKVLEIGPGMGVLTKYLVEDNSYETTVIELDRDSVAWLKKNLPALKDRIIEADFLEADLSGRFKGSFAIIGNFPYNISSQILFRLLDLRDQVPELVGMFQKEVAERIACPPGSKTYGILSVLLQAYYNIEYLFTVHENVFVPPPKVKSAVIRLKRNTTTSLGCDEILFRKVVKAAFNQRRKTLRNSLKQFRFKPDVKGLPDMGLRAERLSVKEFVDLTNGIEG